MTPEMSKQDHRRRFIQCVFKIVLVAGVAFVAVCQGKTFVSSAPRLPIEVLTFIVEFVAMVRIGTIYAIA